MTDTTTRTASWHANYRGDATDAVGDILGVSGFGEQLVVLDATRNPDGSTTLGFGLALVPDIEARIERYDAQTAAELAQAAEHPAFFGNIR